MNKEDLVMDSIIVGGFTEAVVIPSLFAVLYYNNKIAKFFDEVIKMNYSWYRDLLGINPEVHEAILGISMGFIPLFQLEFVIIRL
jgi:tRNA isopentenyl-2-thiomethyl-A-37 hydroxylase MiaE